MVNVPSMDDDAKPLLGLLIMEFQGRSKLGPGATQNARRVAHDHRMEATFWEY